jgi:hypothetical protein
MRRSFAKANSGLLAPHLDFFDFHEYNDAGALDPYRASDFAGKPCIIGECGYSLSRVPYDAAREAAALQNFLRNAHELGYAGCLAWMFSDYQNGNSLSQVVANFADTAPAIKPEQQRTGSCFIATAALGSELHPHVQLLRDYRDGVLLQSRYRAAFERLLEFYYSFSPPIARAMKKSRVLNVFMRYSLVYPIVFGIKGLLPLFDKGLRISKNRMSD